MHHFKTILSHTYVTKVKSKFFIISTIIMLLLIIGFGKMDTIINLFSSDEPSQVLVLDDSEQLLSPLRKSMKEEDINLVRYEVTEYEGKELVEKGEYEGLLRLGTNMQGLPVAQYFSNQSNGDSISETLEFHLQQMKTTMAAQQKGIDEKTIKNIYEPVDYENESIGTSHKSAEELAQARGLVYIILIALYMAILIYGQMIATDVATEKSSRVMEILISSASPVTHMFAKIVGVALLGLTQAGLFIITAFITLYTSKGSIIDEMMEIGYFSASISIYIYAIIFFLLGYLLYATIAAMLGSLVSRVEDVSQLLMPMIFLIMIAFFIAIFGLNAPDSTIVYISSFIPFTSPMIMFLRVGVVEVAGWEIILSIGILISTIILFAFISARIYKGGVLMYGHTGVLKDVKKAFALSKKE